VGAVLDAHQWGLANRAALVAGVGHDDHRQPGVAERGAFGSTTALVELDLVAHPLSGAGNVLRHRNLLHTGEVGSSLRKGLWWPGDSVPAGVAAFWDGHHQVEVPAELVDLPHVAGDECGALGV